MLMIVPETADKIKSMEIRGAGRIARAAAEALLAHATGCVTDDPITFRQEMEAAARMLVATRPTAVSLPNAVHMVMAGIHRAITIPSSIWGFKLSSVEPSILYQRVCLMILLSPT